MANLRIPSLLLSNVLEVENPVAGDLYLTRNLIDKLFVLTVERVLKCTGEPSCNMLHSHIKMTEDIHCHLTC